MTDDAWNVDRMLEGQPLDYENVGAVLAPCELATDPALTTLADRADAPILLYSTGQKRFEQGHGSNSQPVVSLAALSPHEIVSTIRSGIERWRHSRALQIESAKADDQGRERLDFLAAVNHEVRTPLNAILGMAEMLIESPLNPDQERYAHVIRSSGGDLLRVLDQLVDLTRLRGATMRFPRSEFELAKLVQAAAESESFTIGKRSLGISIEINPSLPRTVIGSPDRLQQVLSTLIACSLRQTSSGEIRLSATPHLPENDTSIIRFSIAHTGDAIESDQLDEVLRSFASSAPPISRDHGGVGIGLALAAGLIRAMGGEIWAERETPALCFALPLQAMRHHRDEVESNFALQGTRVCIASPRESESQMLKRTLEMAGAFVEVIDTAAQIPNLINTHRHDDLPIDLVFLDEAECDALELIQAVDSSDGDFVVPKLVAMAFSSDHKHQEPIPAHIAARITRPIRDQEVIQIAQSLTAEKSDDMVFAEQERAMRILVADDSEDNRRLIATFLAKTDNALQFATDGQEAFEMFQTGDFDLVLMDIQMPVMNGYDATESIREHEATEGLTSTPIIALTAFAFDEDARRSLEAGCDEHLTKPIGKQSLLNIVSKYSQSDALLQPHPTSKGCR
ncbi:MAG: response regulator [Myxococcota bacterium]